MKDEDLISFIQARMIADQYSISEHFNITPRDARRAVQKLREKHCIINMQDGTGYFYLDGSEQWEQYLIDKWIKQEMHRIYSCFKHLKGAKMASKDLSQMTIAELIERYEVTP